MSEQKIRINIRFSKISRILLPIMRQQQKSNMFKQKRCRKIDFEFYKLDSSIVRLWLKLKKEREREAYSLNLVGWLVLCKLNSKFADRTRFSGLKRKQKKTRAKTPIINTLNLLLVAKQLKNNTDCWAKARQSSNL